MALRSRRLIRNLIILGVVIAVLLAAVFITIPVWANKIAARTPLPALPNGANTIILAADGQHKLGLIAAEGSNINGLDEKRIPKLSGQAFVAAEDRDFYKHDAISRLGMLRAVYTNAKAGAIAAGGSTITQQYVKQAYTNGDQTADRKAKEIIWAYKIEQMYSKDDILRKYENINYYGRGAVGIDAASQAWFGHSITDVKDPKKPSQADPRRVAEVAFLAALVKAPSYYAEPKSKKEPNKLLHEDEILARRTYVIDGMVKIGAITQQVGNKAQKEPLNITSSTKSIGSNVGAIDPGILDYVKDWLTAWQVQLVKTDAKNQGQTISDDEAAKEGKSNADAMLARGGATITTTISYRLQQTLKDAIKERLPKRNGLTSGAVILNPRDGAVIAMYGGDSGPNNAIYAERQFGSTAKPIVLTNAVMHGYSPAKTVLPAPAYIKLSDGTKIWNDDHKAAPGCQLNLVDGTALSNNITYMQLANNLLASCDGKTATQLSGNYPLNAQSDNDLMRKMGADDSLIPGKTSPANLPNVPTHTLGIGSVTPLKLASMYATLANHGVHTKPYIIRSIKSSDGTVSYQNEAESDRIMSAQQADTVTQVLTKVITKGTAQGAQVPGYPTAGKTGTTKYDALMAQYSAVDPNNDKAPAFVCGIWAGFRDNRDTEGNGGQLWGADTAKVCRYFLYQALQGSTPVQFPKADLNAGIPAIAAPVTPSPSPSSVSPSVTSPSPSESMLPTIIESPSDTASASVTPSSPSVTDTTKIKNPLSSSPTPSPTKRRHGQDNNQTQPTNH